MKSLKDEWKGGQFMFEIMTLIMNVIIIILIKKIKKNYKIWEKKINDYLALRRCHIIFCGSSF